VDFCAVADGDGGARGGGVGSVAEDGREGGAVGAVEDGGGGGGAVEDGGGGGGEFVGADDEGWHDVDDIEGGVLRGYEIVGGVEGEDFGGGVGFEVVAVGAGGAGEDGAFF